MTKRRTSQQSHTVSYRPAAVTISVLLAASALLGGCSSSGPGPAKSSAGSSSHAATSSSAPAATTSSAGSSAATGGGAGGGVSAGGNFCTKAAIAQAEQRQQASAITTGTPASLQALEQKAAAELKAFQAITPSAIKSDLGVVAAAENKLYDALAAVHFDVRKINPASFTGLNTPQFQKATANIERYLSRQCGIKTTG